MTQIGISKVASGSALEGQRLYQQSRSARKPRLLEQLRQALRSRHYSRRTEQTYCQWVKRFIYFHKVRHPAEMAEKIHLHTLWNKRKTEKIGDLK